MASWRVHPSRAGSLNQHCFTEVWGALLTHTSWGHGCTGSKVFLSSVYRVIRTISVWRTEHFSYFTRKPGEANGEVLRIQLMPLKKVTQKLRSQPLPGLSLFRLLVSSVFKITNNKATETWNLMLDVKIHAHLHLHHCLYSINLQIQNSLWTQHLTPHFYLAKHYVHSIICGVNQVL